MMTTSARWQCIFLIAAPLLHGCGGGSSSPPAPPPPPPPPPNMAPTVTDVSILDGNGGNARIGDTLSGIYTYSDIDGDAEGTSMFRWLRNGIEIAGATTVAYVLVAGDVPAMITFEVVPVAATGVSPGTAVVSAPIATSVFSISDATLSSLLVQNVDLVPVFDSGVTTYAAEAPFYASTVAITAATSNPLASFLVNGMSNPTVDVPLGQSNIQIEVTAQDGVTTDTYSITLTRTAIEQKAYVKASNPDLNDFFGDNSVSLSNDGRTMAIGANGEGSVATGVNGDESSNIRGGSGAVYVFVHDGTTWSQQAYIKASNTDSQDRFGSATAMSGDGNTLAISAPREDSAGTGIDGDQTNSGSVAGAVYVFTRDGGGAWSQQAYVKASNTDNGDGFGVDLDLSADGNTLAVSTDSEDGNSVVINTDEGDNSANDSGAAYIFTRDVNQVWSQQAYIKPSNTQSFDRFGGAISLSASGDLLAVGAIAEDSASAGVNGNQTDNSLNAPGAVYVFERDNGSWSQQSYIKASDPDSEDNFGISVALNSAGATLAVGASLEDSNAVGINGDPLNNDTNSTGAVYVYASDTGGVWAQQAYIKALETDDFDAFGQTVAISGDGNLLAVSAPGEDSIATGVNGDASDDNSSGSGAAYLFVRDAGGTWSQVAYIKPSVADADDTFGRGIALSGDGKTLVVEAFGEDSAATGINGDDTDNSVVDAGATYVFQ